MSYVVVTDGSVVFHFNELQIFGRAQMAIVTAPPGHQVNLTFENMIGDRSGSVHVGNAQVMDLTRDTVDLPFSVHVYNGGFLGLAPDTTIHGVTIYMNGTLGYVRNLTLHHGGVLRMNREGHTLGEGASEYRFDYVHVQNDGYIHMITNPVSEPGIVLRTLVTQIDGGGMIRATHLYMHSVNLTIDIGGILRADGLGYHVVDGASYEDDGVTFRRGLHGIINPGLGHTSDMGASGAGHGGSGGRGSGQLFHYLI